MSDPDITLLQSVNNFENQYIIPNFDRSQHNINNTDNTNTFYIMNTMTKAKLLITAALFFLCSLSINGNVRREIDPAFKQYADTVKSRYGLQVSFPGNFSMAVLDQATTWMLTDYSPCGSPFGCFVFGLQCDDGNCLILFEQIPYYNKKSILRAVKNNTGRMKRELSFVIGNRKDGCEGTSKSKLSDYGESLTEYDQKRAKRLFGADKVYSYVVPSGTTVFCYMAPSVDEVVHPMQVLYQNKYPEMRRYFFIKEGCVTYSLTMMLSEKGAANEKKYIKALRNIVKYK